MLEILLQLAIGGILLGAIYALMAFGLTIIYGVAKVLNLTHGDFVMLGGLVSYFLMTKFGLNPFFVIPVLILIFFFSGVMFDRVFVRVIMEKPPQEFGISSILVTLGLALAFEDSSSYAISREFGVNLAIESIKLGEISISSIRLISLIIITFLSIIFQLFLKKTYAGKAIRAVSQDRIGATIVGVDIKKISSITFAIGTFFASLAGLFLILITNISTQIGLPLTAKAVVIVILGGLGSTVGALVGAIILGLSEAFVGYVFGPSWAPSMALILLILILIVRPQGLFGKEGGG